VRVTESGSFLRTALILASVVTTVACGSAGSAETGLATTESGALIAEVPSSHDPTVSSVVSSDVPASPTASSIASSEVTSVQVSVLPEEVLAAANPLLVAMGLPDDSHEAELIVSGRRERLISDCMAAAGFVYEPEIGEVAAKSNVDYQYKLTIDQRRQYLKTYSNVDSGGPGGCFEQASDRVYVVNHFGDAIAEALKPAATDPAVEQANRDRSQCLADNGMDELTLPPPPELNDEYLLCVQILADAQDAAFRLVALEFLRENFLAVQAFGEEMSQL